MFLTLRGRRTPQKKSIHQRIPVGNHNEWEFMEIGVVPGHQVGPESDSISVNDGNRENGLGFLPFSRLDDAARRSPVMLARSIHESRMAMPIAGVVQAALLEQEIEDGLLKTIIRRKHVRRTPGVWPGVDDTGNDEAASADLSDEYSPRLGRVVLQAVFRNGCIGPLGKNQSLDHHPPALPSVAVRYCTSHAVTSPTWLAAVFTSGFQRTPFR